MCSPTSLSLPDSNGFPSLLSASLESLWRLFSCLLQSVSLLTADYFPERMRLSEEKGGIKKAGLTMKCWPTEAITDAVMASPWSGKQEHRREHDGPVLVAVEAGH